MSISGEKRKKAEGLAALVSMASLNLGINCERKELQKHPLTYKEDFPEVILGQFNQHNRLDEYSNVKLSEEYRIDVSVTTKNKITYSAKLEWESSGKKRQESFKPGSISLDENNPLNSKSIDKLINNLEKILPKTYSSVKLGMEGSYKSRGTSTGEKEVNREYKITVDIVPNNNRGLIKKIIYFNESIRYDRGDNIEEEEKENLNSVRETLEQKENELNKNQLKLSPNYK